MSIQVWDKEGKIHILDVFDFEASMAAGIYLLEDPAIEEDKPVKRTRKTKAADDENEG